MIEFKEPHLKDEYEHAPTLLIRMVEDMAQYCAMRYGRKIVVTSVWRKKTTDSGVHEAYRAIDVRNEHAGKRMFSDHEVEEILAYLNTLYPRTDGFKSAIHHAVNGPLHFHLQVSGAMMVHRKPVGQNAS